MFKRNNLRVLLAGLTVSGLALTGCEEAQRFDDENVAEVESEIADVLHSDVERQSIGNCWLYAQASWVESLHLSAVKSGNPGGMEPADTCVHQECEVGVKLDPTCSPCAKAICEADDYCCNNEWDDICTGAVTNLCAQDACNEAAPEEPAVAQLDVSQSYWTYWHWFDQVTGFSATSEISTGGNQWKSHALVRDRGVMKEVDFVPADSDNEMSQRQASALATINTALKSGELSTAAARRNFKLVRDVFDAAWGLSPEVIKELDQVFGEDGKITLRAGSNLAGTHIIDPATLTVKYTRWKNNKSEVREGNLLDAVREWQTVSYPTSASQRRTFLQRVQRALHDRQPVVITWDVDFNAMENGVNERRGSFNMTTLGAAGRPGRQGGHMTVLEDYEAETAEFGLLPAAVTLDPSKPADKKKIDAALLPGTKIKFLRTKNSWGGSRPDRAFAKDFPGYHDLYLDYLNGPIKFCPDNSNPTNENCTGESIPLDTVMLPPGY
jgi:hypothetical protein